MRCGRREAAGVDPAAIPFRRSLPPFPSRICVYDVLMPRDPARIRLARELRGAGHSYGEVAAALGCGRTEAYRLANMPDTAAPARRPFKLSWKERVARMIG
jgi:hypothetical protein